VIYGLYLAATGIVTNSYQQDVIANNLANADTNGFKRTMGLVEARRVAAQVSLSRGDDHPLLDKMSGGQFLAPTYVDHTQGTIEQTGNPLDTAMSGKGFIAVQDGEGQLRLTRAGSLIVDRQGRLITQQGHQVLNVNRQPISLANVPQGQLTISQQGEVNAGQQTLAQIALLEPTDPQSLRPVGENLLAPVGDDAQLVPASGKLIGGALEQSNVEPANELTRLMETQRLLEANANMIKYQDATLAKLVNEVGKIG
jgi:flagellar basal-body rod protein FlgF